MKDLALMTDMEAIEIGNMAFRKHSMTKRAYSDLYQSKKWRLHIFQNSKGKTEKIAIVDEKEPLMNVDYLWSSRPDSEYVSNSQWSSCPMYNWIEISRDLVVSHYTTPNITLMLTPNSQYSIFMALERMGFMGATIESRVNVTRRPTN